MKSLTVVLVDDIITMCREGKREAVLSLVAEVEASLPVNLGHVLVAVTVAVLVTAPQEGDTITLHQRNTGRSDAWTEESIGLVSTTDTALLQSGAVPRIRAVGVGPSADLQKGIELPKSTTKRNCCQGRSLVPGRDQGRTNGNLINIITLVHDLR